jgi:cell division septation protein DedD
MINLLCDRALMVGCEAGSHQITGDFIVAGAKALGLAPPAQRVRAMAPGRRGKVMIGIAALVVAIAAAAYLRGTFTGVGQLPGVSPPEGGGHRLRAVASPTPPEVPLRLMPPPITEGAFAVLIDTFASPRQANVAEATLRARSFPLYAVDLRFASGVRRRLFVGRYHTREEAEKVRAELAPTFGAARVVTATSELWEW